MAFERKYSDELRTRSVERVLARRAAEPRNRAILREVAAEFDVGEQSLRQWVARYDDGSYRYAERPTPGASSAPVDVLADLEGVDPAVLRAVIRDLRERVALLEDQNEVLKKAASIFAAELSRR